MSIVIDPQALISFASQSPFTIAFSFIFNGGWIVLCAIALWMLLHLVEEYRSELYKEGWQWVLLAIDVPVVDEDTEQTPKAVEQIFAHLAGAYIEPDIWEKYWEGQSQPYFSLEIVSIEGYTQFLIWTEKRYVELVQAAVYAQYPDAEINEVQDYVEEFAPIFPNDEYDLWGVEFGLKREDPYPVRTHRFFEHQISGKWVDPMAALLESMSRLGHGEQLWLQIIIRPKSSHWSHKGMKLVNKLIGVTEEHEKTLVDRTLDVPIDLLAGLGRAIAGGEEMAHEEKKKEEKKSIMQDLSPMQKQVVEAVEGKIAQVAFDTKIRGMYIGRTDVFQKDRGVYGLMGAMQQFNAELFNAFVPTVRTTASYFRKAKRKNFAKAQMLKAYQKRKLKKGGNPCILSIEELATLWHFPALAVKAPLVQRAQAKRSEPPLGLPVDRPEVFKPFRGIVTKEQEESVVTEVASELPEEDVGIPEEEVLSDTYSSIGEKKSIGGAGKATPPANLPFV